MHDGRGGSGRGRLTAVLCVQAPGVYWDLTTQRVLTMEFCEGGKVDDLQYIRENKIPVDEVSGIAVCPLLS